MAQFRPVLCHPYGIVFSSITFSTNMSPLTGLNFLPIVFSNHIDTFMHPSGMHLSVENESPPFSHPVGMRLSTSERGIPTGCHDSFAPCSTERYIPTGCVNVIAQHNMLLTHPNYGEFAIIKSKAGLIAFPLDIVLKKAESLLYDSVGQRPTSRGKTFVKAEGLADASATSSARLSALKTFFPAYVGRCPTLSSVRALPLWDNARLKYDNSFSIRG